MLDQIIVVVVGGIIVAGVGAFFGYHLSELEERRRRTRLEESNRIYGKRLIVSIIDEIKAGITRCKSLNELEPERDYSISQITAVPLSS